MKKLSKGIGRRKGASTAAAPPRENHEETLNFSNLTEFRNSLLQVIPKLQEDDLLRFVITKHGEPAAVIMSYEAYSVLKRIADRAIEQDDALDEEEAVRQAYARMNEDELQSAPDPTKIAETLQQVMLQLTNALQVTKMMKPESAAVKEAVEFEAPGQVTATS